MNRTRPKDLLARFSAWLRTDRASLDVTDRVERLWRETELPSLRQLTERFHIELDLPALPNVLERAQADLELPSLASLSDRLPRDFELPELPVSLSPQHRQVLRGVLLLGMALNSGPVPLLKSSPPCSGSRASIADTRRGDSALAGRASAGQRYVLIDAGGTRPDASVTADASPLLVAAVPAPDPAPAAASPTRILPARTHDRPLQLAFLPTGSRAPPA